MSYHYPPLPADLERQLATINAVATEHGDYFLDDDCPYSDRMKVFLTRMITSHSVAPDDKHEETFEDVSMDDIDDHVIQDSYRLYQKLQAYGKALGKSDQTEMMSYFRTSAGLIQKIVDLRSKALGVKQVKEFQDAVLGVMEDVLTPDQRTKIMTDLRAVLSRQNPEDLLATPTPEVIEE